MVSLPNHTTSQVRNHNKPPTARVLAAPVNGSTAGTTKFTKRARKDSDEGDHLQPGEKKKK